MNRNQCEELILETVIQANEIWPNLNMDLPEVDWFQTGRVAGRAWKFTHKVGFNEVLMNENGDNFKGTVVHEIAHRVTNTLYPNAKQAHGPEFKYVFAQMLKKQELAPRGIRHDYSVASVVRGKMYVYKCSAGCEHEITQLIHKRIQAQDQVRIFRQCGGRINKAAYTLRVVG